MAFSTHATAQANLNWKSEFMTWLSLILYSHSVCTVYLITWQAKKINSKTCGLTPSGCFLQPQVFFLKGGWYFSPFYGWGNTKWSILLLVTQLSTGRTRIQAQGSLIPKSVLFPIQLSLSISQNAIGILKSLLKRSPGGGKASSPFWTMLLSSLEKRGSRLFPPSSLWWRVDHS